MKRWLWLPLLLLGALTPSTAGATGVRLGLGADYWFVNRGLFNLTLGLDGRVARYLSVGGRFGGLIIPNYRDTTVGIPLDLSIRGHLANDRVYLEGLAGPWILFTSAPVRAHVGFGFGLQTGPIAVGLELGWLDPATLVGVKFAFRL